MGKGQVALTMHHIGLGQSNVAVNRRSGRGARSEPWAWITARGWGLASADASGPASAPASVAAWELSRPSRDSSLTQYINITKT